VAKDTTTDGIEPWRTGITTYDDAHIWIHGYDVTEMMTRTSFSSVVFLLHKGRLPSEGERRLIDAILIASADHGPGSPSAAAARTVATGNRRAPEAAVAAGVLAIGDAHGGAGLACMEMIAAGVARAERDHISIADSASLTATEARETRQRLPGMGHRTHSTDPRTAVIFGLAEQHGLARRGVEFIRELERSVASTVKPLPVNVDGAIAAVLYDLDFPPVLGKLLFIIGRVAGLTAQVVEEYTREKPMRVKVATTYDGPPPRPLPDPSREEGGR
jgi:citrate synthase